MKLRNSENRHFFQEALFEKLNAYSLQGLLMDKNHEFTAAVEAVSSENTDNKTLFPYAGNSIYPFSDGLTEMPLTEKELHARYVLASAVGIPLYIVFKNDTAFNILNVSERNGSLSIDKTNSFNADEFAEWWGSLKGTIQTKKLNNGGESRLANTDFDSLLRRYGLEWGGNIDGFALSRDGKSVKYIIDNISVSRANLDDDPSNYFNSPNPAHGPRYESWYAAVKLAKKINIPHALFTIDKKNNQAEHIGFAIIRKLSPEGIFYVNDKKSNDNVISGMDNIVRFVNYVTNITNAPELIEKDNNMQTPCS